MSPAMTLQRLPWILFGLIVVTLAGSVIAPRLLNQTAKVSPQQPPPARLDLSLEDIRRDMPYFPPFTTGNLVEETPHWTPTDRKTRAWISAFGREGALQGVVYHMPDELGSAEVGMFRMLHNVTGVSLE